MAEIKWYVITGPPCCGKSMTVELLAQRGLRVRSEIARAYADEEIAKGRQSRKSAPTCELSVRFYGGRLPAKRRCRETNWSSLIAVFQIALLILGCTEYRQSHT